MSDTGGGAKSSSLIATGLATTLTLLAIAWSLGLPRILSLQIYPQQYFSAILTLALPLAFLSRRINRGTGPIPWFDWILAALAFASSAYVTLYYPEIVNKIFFRPLEAYVPGTLIILLTLEALRRVTGWSLVIIISVFLIYAMFGDHLPSRLAGKAQDWPKLAGYLAYDSNGILGIPLSVASKIIIAFILFGTLLNVTGGARFFTDAALLAMGRFRGGSMKIAIAASALFGSISGSAVANVVATGVVTIPMIKRDGYSAHKAAAIEAVASTGGQLMPPVMGAAAFLMAEFLQIPYSEIVLAALIPALLYYGALFVLTDLEAAKLGITATDPKEIPQKRTILGGLHFVLAFALLLYALFFMHWQPERAALLGCASVATTALLLGYRGQRPQFRALVNVLSQTGMAVVEIVIISAAAGIVIGVLNITGLSFNLTYFLVQVGDGNLIWLLLLSAIVCIILGMGLPTLGVYVLLAALVAPALVEVGVHPIAAHLFVLYFGMMSMITPPIALAAFAAAGVAKADPMATGMAAVRFGWVAFCVPFLFAFSPTMIGIGAWPQIALDVGTAALGIWMICIGIVGFFGVKLNFTIRCLFAGAGIACMLPVGSFSFALLVNSAGVLLAIGLLAIGWRSSCKKAKD